MTITPPQWRLSDWYLITFIEGINDFNPFPALISALVLGPLFFLLGLLCVYRLHLLKREG